MTQPKKTAEDYRRLARDKGYQWCGFLPEITANKCQWICPDGHVRRTSYHQINRGTQCMACFNKKKSERTKVAIRSSGRFAKQIVALVVLLILLASPRGALASHTQKAVAGPINHRGALASYTQKAVCGPINHQGYKIVVVGDSVTYESLMGVGWMDVWNQMNAAYHPDLNIQLVNAGYAYLSNTVLNHYPQLDPITHLTDGPWQACVVNQQPDCVVIWIGIDNILINNGITQSSPFDMTMYGQDLQNIIDAARAIPSVQQVVLVTPLCAGEKRYGQNPQDGQMDNLCRVIEQTSINNGVPVIDMRSMMQCADVMYNSGNVSTGCLTGDGIHPYTPTSGPHPGFLNQSTFQIMGLTMYKAFGE